MSDAEIFDIENDSELQETGLELNSTFTAIVQQCSEPIFHVGSFPLSPFSASLLVQIIREKITNFVATSSFSPKTSQLVNGLVRAILKGNPTETVKSLLPQTCERIEKILSQADASIFDDHHGDWELRWALVLFSELVRARGDTLLPYKSMIESVLLRCRRLIHKDSNEALAAAARNLLKSLLNVYPIESQLIYDPTFKDSLPIRVSGFPSSNRSLELLVDVGRTRRLRSIEPPISHSKRRRNRFRLSADRSVTLRRTELAKCKLCEDEQRGTITIADHGSMHCNGMFASDSPNTGRTCQRDVSEHLRFIKENISESGRRISSVVPLQSQYYVPFTMFEKEPGEKR